MRSCVSGAAGRAALGTMLEHATPGSPPPRMHALDAMHAFRRPPALPPPCFPSAAAEPRLRYYELAEGSGAEAKDGSRVTVRPRRHRRRCCVPRALPAAGSACRWLASTATPEGARLSALLCSSCARPRAHASHASAPRVHAPTLRRSTSPASTAACLWCPRSRRARWEATARWRR